MEKFYTPEQIAEILQINVQTVLAYLRDGRLKALKLDKGYRISEGDFRDFAQSTREPKTPENYLLQIGLQKQYKAFRKVSIRPVNPIKNLLTPPTIEDILKKATVKSRPGFRAFPMPEISQSEEEEKAWSDGLLFEKSLVFAGDLYFFAFASNRGEILTAESLWEDDKTSIFKNAVGLLTSIGNMYRSIVFIHRYYSHIPDVQRVSYQFIIDNPGGRHLVMDDERGGFFWREDYVAITEDPIIIQREIDTSITDSDIKNLVLDMTKEFMWYFHCKNILSDEVILKRIEDVVQNIEPQRQPTG